MTAAQQSMTINMTRSGVRTGLGGSPTLTLCLEAETRDPLESEQTRARILTLAAEHFQFGNAGLANQPTAYPVDAATDEAVAEDRVYDKQTQIKCFRIEYLLNQRL